MTPARNHVNRVIKLIDMGIIACAPQEKQNF